MANLYKNFHNEVDFLTIYVKEDHPKDEWELDSNANEGICYLQPVTIVGRIAIAKDFIKRMDYPIPLVVDTMENLAYIAYAVRPEKLYVIENGKIIYEGEDLGPLSFKPSEVRTLLENKLKNKTR